MAMRPFDPARTNWRHLAFIVAQHAPMHSQDAPHVCHLCAFALKHRERILPFLSRPVAIRETPQGAPRPGA